MATLSMAHKLMMETERHRRRLNGCQLPGKAVSGAKIEAGMEMAAA